MLTLFREYESLLAAGQLILAMAGMGATLTIRDFTGIPRRRGAVALVLSMQYLIIPLSVVAIARWLVLPSPVVLGLAVLVVMPSGAMSNLFTHLGRGNLPLSITLTFASTLACLVFTPWLLPRLAGPLLQGEVVIPVALVTRDVAFYLLIPIAAGMAVRRFCPRQAASFSKLAVRASLVVLSVIAVGSLRSGRIDVWEFGWSVPGLLIALLVGQLLATRVAFYGIGYSASDAYALSIEIAFRNGNLAILFSSTLFNTTTTLGHQLSGGVLYVALFYGGASLIAGTLISVAQQHLPVMRYQRSDPIAS